MCMCVWPLINSQTPSNFFFFHYLSLSFLSISLSLSGHRKSTGTQHIFLLRYVNSQLFLYFFLLLQINQSNFNIPLPSIFVTADSFLYTYVTICVCVCVELLDFRIVFYFFVSSMHPFNFILIATEVGEISAIYSS